MKTESGGEGGRDMAFELEKYTAPDFAALGLESAADARTAEAPLDGVAPENYHAMSIFPEYFRVGGKWVLAAESRMDCVPVLTDGGRVDVREPRRLKKGERVFTGRTEDGSQGIFVWPYGFEQKKGNGRRLRVPPGAQPRDGVQPDYDELYDVLRHDRDHGKIVWVLGPAFAFDSDARRAFATLIENGYVDALLAGNALATHDLEAAYLGTALGQNIYTQHSVPNGHYNHLDTINRVKLDGSIPKFIEKEGIDQRDHLPVRQTQRALCAGGVDPRRRPLPEVIRDVYQAQDAMRAQVKGATTVICMATMLHTIATAT